MGERGGVEGGNQRQKEKGAPKGPGVSWGAH